MYCVHFRGLGNSFSVRNNNPGTETNGKLYHTFA